MTHSVKEIELCFLCEVKDKSGYDKADSVEEHEQWEFRLPNDEQGNRRGRQRVRRTVKNGDISYTMAVKSPLKKENSIGDDEENENISAEFFECWKRTFQPTGQIKTRYEFVANKTTVTYNGESFELPQLVYEVDVLQSKDGKRSVYAKVDIEIQDALAFIKQKFGDNIDSALFKFDFSRLPLGIGRVVDCGTKDPEVRKEIDEYFKFFSIPFDASLKA